MLQNQKTIVNAMALNEDGVLVTGGDNGSVWFWDWRSGNCFQREAAIVQPGSLESEAGIFACTFDVTGGPFLCSLDRAVVCPDLPPPLPSIPHCASCAQRVPPCHRRGG